MKQDKRSNNKQNNIKNVRINDEIRGYEMVRLIYNVNSFQKTDEDFNKIVTLHEAKRLSEEYGLDLIEINGTTSPPIIRLYDYNKYVFEQKKSQKEKTKNNNNNTLKEVQLKVNISEHDLQIKANKAKEFIKNGSKVKVVLTMRGRENTRRDFSKECFYKFIEMMSDVAITENTPKDEGNKVIVILKKKK